MTSVSEQTMRATLRIARAIYLILFVAAGVVLAAAARAANGPPTTGKLPSMSDLAPGVDEAGALRPEMYILAAAVLTGFALALAGLSLMIWLILRLSKLHTASTEAIVAENRAAIKELTTDAREATEAGRAECHRYGAEIAAKAEAASQQSSKAATDCAVALGRCNDTMERLDDTLRELKQGRA